MLIAFHDNKLDRVTDGHRRIADLTYEVVSQRQDRRASMTSRGFDDLLTSFPDARFNIDAKSAASVDLLARTIADHERTNGSASTRSGSAACTGSGDGSAREVSSASAAGIALNRFGPWLTAALNTTAPALQIPSSNESSAAT